MVKANQQLYFERYSIPIFLGWLLIIICFFIIGSLIGWNAVISDWVGSTFMNSGDIGPILGEIALFILLILAGYLIFSFGRANKDMEKLALIGDAYGLKTLSGKTPSRIVKIDMNGDTTSSPVEGDVEITQLTSSPDLEM